MSPPRYLYVSDQGRVFSSTDDPTAEDFAYAEVGMLTIFRLADNHHYRRDGKWCPVARGKRVSAEIEGISPEEFHSHPADSRVPVTSEISLPNSMPEKPSDRCWTRPNPTDARRRSFTSP